MNEAAFPSMNRSAFSPHLFVLILGFASWACEDDASGNRPGDAAVSVGGMSDASSRDTNIMRDAGMRDAGMRDARRSDTGLPDASGGKLDASVTFDLTAQFPAATNPGGVWSYGWAATLGATVTIFPAVLIRNDGSPQWYDPAHNTSFVPTGWKNLSDANVTGVPGGFAALHPGPAGEYAVARFTAPEAGTYSGMLQLFAGDGGETDATLYVDGASTALGPTSTGPSHIINATALAAGDTVEVWVGPSGDFDSDNTPLTLVLRRQ